MLYSKKTNKLFFEKYAYKVSITTPLAPCFRGKNLTKTQDELNFLAHKFNPNLDGKVQVGQSWSKRYASFEDIISGTRIIETLNTIDDFTLRVEGSILGIYFNEEDILDKIVSIRNIEVREVSKPENDSIKDFLLSNPKRIIRKEYTHKFKVAVKALWNEAPDFLEWASKMPKIKLNRSSYKYGGYFYVADAKTLSVCRLYLGNKLSKVEEIVTHSEI